MSGNDFFTLNTHALSPIKQTVNQNSNFFPPTKKLTKLKLKKRIQKSHQHIEPLIMVYGDPVEVHVKPSSPKTNSPLKRARSVTKKEPLNIQLKLPKSSVDYNHGAIGELPNLTSFSEQNMPRLEHQRKYKLAKSGS